MVAGMAAVATQAAKARLLMGVLAKTPGMVAQSTDCPLVW
jgi:hypothetical protein